MTQTEARIFQYFHCKRCTDLESMNTSEVLSAGWTEQGCQVFCENCGHNVIDIDFNGQNVTLHEKYEAQ